jgi:sugar phosphate isomerase/epimerase
MKNPLLISTTAYDGYDFETAFKEIANHGIELVEVAFIEGYTDPFDEDYFNETNAEMIGTRLKENNLTCLSFSAHMDLAREDAVPVFKRRMTFAGMLGAKYIVSNAGPQENKASFMENIRELGQVAEEMAMVIVLENPGDGKPNIIDSAEPAAGVIADIGLETVKLNYDFGNLMSHCFEKIRPEADYGHAIDATAHFHIKDVAANETGWYFTEVGQGVIDYHQILKEIVSRPEPIPLSLEIPLRVTRAPDASPRRAAAPIDLNTIRQVMAGSVAFVKERLL